MSTDRRFRLARVWSNRELRRIAPCFHGSVVNVSAWDDRDKEGGHYRDYFAHASSYFCTNYPGYRGFQGMPNEQPLDLTGDLPATLRRRYDVVFNHTTLEHIFDVRRAFANLCDLSKDVVIVVVPFAQVQHDAEDWKDYWRFTPACLRKLYEDNGLSVIYEADSPFRKSAIYLLSVAAREPNQWTGLLPPCRPITTAGSWIGYTLTAFMQDGLRKVAKSVRGVRGREGQ
ncbi:MAG: hypothetical protein NTZ17_11435 [Phycisphaerae bacterium]|nr:hypothetical protein [Phycisphaerae bacterium]